MDFSEAKRLLSTKFDLDPETSTPRHAEFFPRLGQEPKTASVYVTAGEDGRIIQIGSDWTPSTESVASFAQMLRDLVSLIASLGAWEVADDCRLLTVGGRLVIACGSHSVHIVRTLTPPDPDGAAGARLQLWTGGNF
jgi:hypothetical protein